MMASPIVRFLNVVVAAVLAGVSFGIWIGFNPSGLSAAAYFEQQQNMLQSLRILMVALVFIATSVTILSAYIQKHDKFTSYSLVIAAVLFITCILITLFGNKPIDDKVIIWTKDTIPDNWAELRDNWWTFHILRTIAEIAVFLLITWASVRKDNKLFIKTA